MCDLSVFIYVFCCSELLETQKTLYVVLELGSCDLHEVLKELSINRRHLPLYKLMYYWMEMLHAVQEIHDNGAYL